MKKINFAIKIFVIVLLWLISSGSFIEGYFALGFLSGFLGVWIIAMPYHYERGRGKFAWVVVFLGFAIMLLMLQWYGT